MKSEKNITVDVGMEDFGHSDIYRRALDKAAYERDTTAALINLITICGKTKQVEQFLASSVEDFKGADFSKIDQKNLLIVLNRNLEAANQRYDVACEGWLNNVFQNIRHSFTKDSKCAEIINAAITKWQSADPSIVEKKVDFNLMKPEAIKEASSGVVEALKMVGEYSEFLAKATKFFGGGTNSEERQKMLDEIDAKFKKFAAASKAMSDRYDQLTFSTCKGKTFQEAGYTKDTVVEMLKAHAVNIAGQRKKLLDIVDFVWRFGAKLKIGAGPAIGSDGSVGVAVSFTPEIKPKYKMLVETMSDALSLYGQIDYCMYRLAKMV